MEYVDNYPCREMQWLPLGMISKHPMLTFPFPKNVEVVSLPVKQAVQWIFLFPEHYTWH